MKVEIPAALDNLCDICGRLDAVADMLDIVHEECTEDGRICNAVYGVFRLTKSLVKDLDDFRADFEKGATQ